MDITEIGRYACRETVGTVEERAFESLLVLIMLNMKIVV